VTPALQLQLVGPPWEVGAAFAPREQNSSELYARGKRGVRELVPMIPFWAKAGEKPRFLTSLFRALVVRLSGFLHISLSLCCSPCSLGKVTDIFSSCLTVGS